MEEPRPLSAREVDREVSREVALIKESAIPVVTQRQCRVCRDEDARRRVNQMLKHSMSATAIVENLADVNAKKPKNQQITQWVVRNHRQQHFNVQEAVANGYRNILERRAAEDAELIGQAAASVLTARGYLEVIALKGWENLVQEETKVPFDIGAQAQVQLEKLVKSERGEAEVVRMRADVAMLSELVDEILTEDQRRELMRMIAIRRGQAVEEDGDVIDAEEDDDDEDSDFDDEEGDD